MILITGASGNNGTEILRGLAGLHQPIRAMIRKESDRATIDCTGAEIALADFDDVESLRRALEGTELAFLVTPSSERVEEQQLRFVELAREAGTRHIVYLSQLHASPDSPVRFLRYHAAVERALSNSGLTYTNLRPNLYMQGLLLFKDLIRSKGQIMAPIGEARVSAVDVRDIAAIAVAALTESGHENKTYDITGPEALTHGEMAQELSRSLARPITFVDISPSSMLDALLSLHMPRWQAEGLVEDYEHYQRGEAEAISTAVEDVTGRRPRDFRTFARDFATVFNA